MRNLQKRVRTLRASFLKIGGGLGGMGGFAGIGNLFVGGAAAAALTWPVKLASHLEVTTARFTALLGSAEDAKMVIGELEQFSKVSLISVDALHDGTALLAQYGVEVDKLMPAVKNLTEIAGGSTERFQRLSLAYAQVRSRTKLLATEVRQFAESGFAPLEEIAKGTGETIQQVSDRMEKGAVSFEELDNALHNATARGGRFHGLLSTIGSTASGQFKKLRASFALAIRPLGQNLLPGLATFVGALNDAMPAFERFIKQNAGLVTKLASVALGVVAAASAFIGIGLALTLVSIAAGGFMSALSIIGSLLGLVFSPLGAIAAALYGLAQAFPEMAASGIESVRSMGRSFVAWYSRIFNVATETYDGIVDALKAGDMKLAGEVAMAGLHLVWLEGTRSLRELWFSFKDSFLRTTVEMVFEAVKHFNTLSAEVRGIWSSMVTSSRSVGEKIGHYLSRSSDPDVAADQDAEHEKALTRITNEGLKAQTTIDDELKDALNKVEEARKTAEAIRSDEDTKEREAAKTALEAARQRLKAATEEARRVRREAGLNRVEEQKEGQRRWNPNQAIADSFKSAGGLFDTRFARQMLVGPQDQQIQLLGEIAKNTRNNGWFIIIG